MKMKDKRVLVTGGNSGIGRGIVHRFVREGAIVALCGRDQTKGDAVLREVDEMGGEAVFHSVDLAVESSVQGLAAKLKEGFGEIDIVINNAGIGGRRSSIEDRDGPGTRWDKLRGPNLDAPYFVSAYTLPLLAAAGGGAIVNISSTATWHGNWGLYGVAKAGVEALTRAFAAEGAADGIRVNGVSPGWIETERDATSSASGSADGGWSLPPSLLGRMGTADEIAAAVLFLASSDASFITGQTLIVDDGLMVTDYPSMPLLEGIQSRLSSGVR